MLVVWCPGLSETDGKRPPASTVTSVISGFSFLENHPVKQTFKQ